MNTSVRCSCSKVTCTTLPGRPARRGQRRQFSRGLFARINLWTYALPGLAQRAEDIEPNLDYLLEQFCCELGEQLRFNKEARQRYMSFASSCDAVWRGNFRDLSASVMRMATLAQGGRISLPVVESEIDRLREQWGGRQQGEQSLIGQLLPADRLAAMDLFDRLQLDAVIRICRDSKNLSDAGRKLFEASMSARSSANDADRLRKYLARFGMTWAGITKG